MRLADDLAAGYAGLQPLDLLRVVQRDRSVRNRDIAHKRVALVAASRLKLPLFRALVSRPSGSKGTRSTVREPLAARPNNYDWATAVEGEGVTDPYELPETGSAASTPWWQQRNVVLGAVVAALAATGGAFVLVSGGGREDTLRAAAPEVTVAPSASASGMVEPTPEPMPSDATTLSPEATTPSAAPATTAAATRSPSPTPVTIAAAPAAPVPPIAGKPSPTKSAAPAPAPSPTATAPGDVYITFTNQTTQELRFSADTRDPGSTPVAVVVAPGTQKRIVFRPNPQHATSVVGSWTQNPDCSAGDAPGLPAPGSYTIIQRYEPSGSPGPTACAGHGQMEMVSPDADGMKRP